MVKNNYSKTKYGFSLIEALIVMSIFAIFVAVTANVIPHKAKPKVSADAHGGFECYYSGDKLYSRTITVGTESSTALEETGSDANGKYCLFRPNPYINYLIFNAVGGGSYGGESGGGSGQYASAFFPTPKTIYKLYPGKGGTISSIDGTASFVKSGDDTILSVNGGNNTFNVANTTTSDIVDIYTVAKMPSDVVAYGCDYTPRAWLNQADGLIHVLYCATSADIKEKTLIYSDNSLALYPASLDRYNTILQSPANSTSSKPLSRQKSYNVWEYYDVGEWVDYRVDPLTDSNCSYASITSMNDPMCPSRYKLEIILNIPNNGDEGAVSPLTKYATLLQYTNLINAKPGNGGAKGNHNGSDGAILISW